MAAVSAELKVKLEVLEVEGKITKTKEELAATEAEQAGVGAQLQQPDLSAAVRDDLQKKEKHLRDMVEQLRTKEKQLRKQDELLQDKLLKAMAAPTSFTMRIGAVGYAVAAALLGLIKLIFGKQYSKAEGEGCPWWLAGSAEQGASLLLQVLHVIGVLTRQGAHQLVDLTAEWLQLQKQSDAIANSLQRVPFLPAGARRFMVRAVVECAAVMAALAVHCVSLAVFGMVADLASRVFWV